MPHDHIWVAERCGANSCADSKLDPIFEFDRNGKMLRNFGGGMFDIPSRHHGRTKKATCGSPTARVKTAKATRFLNSRRKGKFS